MDIYAVLQLSFCIVHKLRKMSLAVEKTSSGRKENLCSLLYILLLASECRNMINTSVKCPNDLCFHFHLYTCIRMVVTSTFCPDVCDIHNLAWCFWYPHFALTFVTASFCPDACDIHILPWCLCNQWSFWPRVFEWCDQVWSCHQ